MSPFKAQSKAIRGHADGNLLVPLEYPTFLKEDNKRADPNLLLAKQELLFDVRRRLILGHGCGCASEQAGKKDRP
jgi:hypothetical protein